jgi:hypothetical protein
MKRFLIAGVLVAVVVAGGRATEPTPYSSRLWLELVSDSVWSHCELRVTVDDRGKGTARSQCRYEEAPSPKPIESTLTPAEVDHLRALLRGADLYSGQSWGYDTRGLDGPLITLTASDRERVTMVVCVRNESFDSGPRKALLDWLSARMRAR